jgi:hypothetical protein
MSTAELKLDIINTIANIKESYIIEDIKKLIDFELNNETYTLNDIQKRRVADAKTDNILSETEANRQIEEWLNEK